RPSTGAFAKRSRRRTGFARAVSPPPHGNSGCRERLSTSTCSDSRGGRLKRDDVCTSAARPSPLPRPASPAFFALDADDLRRRGEGKLFLLTHHPQLALALCMALARCGRRPRSGGGSWRRGRTFD